MIKIGIFGKTNVGKTCFFVSSTLAPAKIENRPFTTLKCNVGVGYVRTECPCKELNLKCNPQNSLCKDGIRLVPIKLIDVAGLIPGAHLGKGFGFKFLDDLRRASALIHVIDASGTSDEEGNPTTGYNPAKDIIFVQEEFDLWLLDILKRGWRALKRVDLEKKDLVKALEKRLSGLDISEEQIREALKASNLEKSPLKWSEEELKKFVTTLRELSKPILIAANKIDLPQSEKNLKKLKQEFPNLDIIPTCAEAELALRRASKKGMVEYVPGDSDFKILKEIKESQKKALEFVRELLKKWGTTGVQQAINKTVFDLLEMVVVYPVANVEKLSDRSGNVLPDAYLVKKDTTLKAFASTIHSDMAERFIGGIDARTKKKLGADYRLKHNDIVKILFRK